MRVIPAERREDEGEGEVGLVEDYAASGGAASDGLYRAARGSQDLGYGLAPLRVAEGHAGLFPVIEAQQVRRGPGLAQRLVRRHLPVHVERGSFDDKGFYKCL